MTPRTILACVAVLALPVCLSGCTKPSGAGGADELLTTLQLQEEPDGGQTVLEVRYALLGEPAEHDHEHDHDHAAGDETAADDDHDHDHGDHDHAEEVGDDDEDAAATPTAGMHDHEHDHGLEGLEHEHEHPVADEDHAGADHDQAATEDQHAHEHAEHDHAEDEHDHADHDHADHDHAARDTLEVVMVGVVGGVPNPYPETQPEFPFVKGKSVVFLADPGYVAEQQVEGHQHAPGEECAFCEAHADDAAHAVAMVRFIDDAGQPLNADLQKLATLKPGQTLVVRGVAKVLPGDALMVDATGYYLRD